MCGFEAWHGHSYNCFQILMFFSLFLVSNYTYSDQVQRCRGSSGVNKNLCAVGSRPGSNIIFSISEKYLISF